MNQQTTNLLIAALRTVTALLITVSLGLSGWSLKTTGDNRVAIAEMRASDFTDDQGIEVWKKIGEIDKGVALAGKANEDIVDRIDRLDMAMRREFDELKREVKKQD